MHPLSSSSWPAWLAGGALALCVLAVATPGGAHAWPPRPTRPPEHLSRTGLFDASGAIDPENLAFAPQYPLWSDGATKARWVYLPPGKRIETSRVDAWDFPVGTRFWKEFAFAGKKVETRMSWRVSEAEWVFATYVWNEDGTDATLAPAGGARTSVELAPGKTHVIPSIDDCGACHEAGPSVVLGFGALQLSDDRDPLAPHAEPLAPAMVTLRSLDEAGLLYPARPELVRDPPSIRADTPRERAALGYLASNCGHCHNASGPLAPLGLVLAHDPAAEGMEAAIASTVRAVGRFLVPGVPAELSRRVAPGAPDHSALLYRMGSRWPASQMPPLGTALPDAEALALVRAWIAEDLTRR